MRLTVLATVAVSSVVALVGFAGAAQASATIDLIWIDVSNTNAAGDPICLRADERNCPQLGTTISSVAVNDITLGVIITAGAGGVSFAGLAVGYGDALSKLSVTDFQDISTTLYLPHDSFPPPNNDTEGWVVGLGAAGGRPFPAGIGLPAGQTAYLGTVTFHKDAFLIGTFEIAVRTGDGPGGEVPRFDSGLFNLAFDSIESTATFNSAFLVNLVAVCHRGKSSFSVPANAVPAHLAHGDTLGACP